MSTRRKIALAVMVSLLVCAVALLTASIAYAAPEDELNLPEGIDATSLLEGEDEEGNVISKLLSGDNATTVQIIALMTILSLAPSILIMLTGFTRIIIILSFIRNAIGMQNMPPNQVMVGLALFVTLLVMYPTLDRINVEAYQPLVAEEIEAGEAFDRAMVPLRDFMHKQTFSDDIDFMLTVSDVGEVETLEDVPDRVLIPSFIISELKRAFWIGFFIYVPFIVIDMVVASVLMSMGMMMLPPTVISLPFKILLFIVVNGWQLTIGSIISSFVT